METCRPSEHRQRASHCPLVLDHLSASREFPSSTDDAAGCAPGWLRMLASGPGELEAEMGSGTAHLLPPHLTCFKI